MTEINSLFAAFVAEARAAIIVPGASAELSVTGKLDAFLSAALPGAAERPFQILQQTRTEFGVPDFRINDRQELLGWVEFKAVVGKDLTKLTGHDKTQRELFVAGLHNVVLTNGWQWELYQDSKRVRKATFAKELFSDDILLPADAAELDRLGDLLRTFATGQLSPYDDVAKAVTALASRAKAIKIALIDLGPSRAGGHLTQLRADFAALLYRNGQPFTWEKFVDSYVQIAAFGALLWRLESGQDISLAYQVSLKQGVHPLLSQCLAILWSPQSQVDVLKPLLEELCRTVNLVPVDLFTAPPRHRGRLALLSDPIVHAYEPFFRRYDQASREANGVYYTPVEVVQQIVSGVDSLLRSALGRTDGILDESARFLDPATGTGTFLLGLANEIAHRAEQAGLPTDQVVHEVLTQRTSAFELFPGPYTIAHQRMEALLTSLGTPPTERLPIYLADTLAAPESGQLPMPGFGPAGAEILAERERADWIKTDEDILVILGNPPYERVKTTSGGWDVFAAGLMREVVDATPPERRADLKSATDLFVAFWAWALWALRSPADRLATAQHPTISTGGNHGMVAFVTNRTWIIGPSLVGLRRLVRDGVKEAWVHDLGGDSRGGSGAQSFAGGDANVFGIRTGVAIVWLVFDRDHTGPPTVRYRRDFGNRTDKLAALAEPFDPDAFAVVDGDDLFVPTSWPAALAAAPTLPDLFDRPPFTGIQSARDTGDVSPWAVDAAGVYSETRARPSDPPTRTGSLGAWYDLTEPQRRSAWSTADSLRRNRPVPDRNRLDPAKVRKALYRPLDTRHVYDDPNWIDWYRDDLHAVYADGPVPTLLSVPRDFGAGPLAVHTDLLPDQHAFKGQAGGKGVFPLWLPAAGQTDDGRRIVAGRRCGLSDTALDWAHSTFPESPDPAQSAYDYVLAVLSAPAYAERFWPELETTGPRVPLTSDRRIALQGAALGGRLRLAWTGQAPNGGARWAGTGHGPAGPASYGDDGTIRFANGRTVTGVPHAAWTFSVSDHKVLPEWLSARQHWTATINQAQETLRTVAAVTALADAGSELDDLFDLLVGPGDPAVITLSPVARRRRDAIAAGIDLVRVTEGSIGLDPADVTVTVDCEHQGGHVYLWGATVRRPGHDDEYVPHASWASQDAEAERALAAEFVAWLTDVRVECERNGQRLAVYHYGATEPAKIRKALAGDLVALRTAEDMIDLLPVVRDHFAGVAGKGLKVVAGRFGTVWRDAGTTGADTLGWIRTARGEGSDAAAARDQLLRYNEDDTRAVAVVAATLSSAGPL